MIFPTTETPRVIGVPPGADFPQVLYDNLLRLTDGRAPHTLARVDVLVPTQRMKRRLLQLFEQGPASLLPRIGTITDITHLLPGVALPPTASSLRRMPSQSPEATVVSLSM